MIRNPPYLQKGNTIGITCPAGYLEAAKAAACISTLQSWGYEVMVGKTLGSLSTDYFSGTDEERRDELQAMLDDKNIHAILCGRGGYGVSRIIDQLNFTAFKKNPKWIIGFSDITILHAHLYRRLKIGSLHAPMAVAFNTPGIYIDAFRKAITGKKATYRCPFHPLNKTGKATGELIGGNLSMLAHITGTPSDIRTAGRILFLEDIGEYIYNIDRMLRQLQRSGKLDELAGLVIGGFTDIKDTIRPFGKKVEAVISEIVSHYSYPVCYGFPVSHETANYALKIGSTYRLEVNRSGTKLVQTSD